ncbi:MAG: hypothetical protein M1569_01305 [Candidatus Marsarchaeota archaeon]|nr:hypothetical protein [Candidatus Marsarchaeota archaeon]
MSAKYYLLLIASVALVVAGAAGASSASLSSLFSTYNVSSALANSLTYTNATYAGVHYLLAYNNGSPFFLINTSSGYSFVTDPVAVGAIVAPAIIGKSLRSVNATYLSSSMQKYEQSSSGPINDCLVETGLSSGATCTYQNNCQSCTQIPACGGAARYINGHLEMSPYYSTGGFYGPIGQGVVQFESDYGALQSNLSIFLNNVAILNVSNAQSSMSRIQSSFSSISGITKTLDQNPIFPPPQSIDYSLCGNYGSGTSNAISPSGPWYCDAVGFCQFTTYNYTLLANMQDYLTHASTLAITSSQISSISSGIVSNENAYVVPVQQRIRRAQLNGIMNTTLRGYAAQTSGARMLLSHLPNATLEANLNRLSANYSLLNSTYLTANLVALNSTLKKQYGSFKSTYAALNSTYYSVLGTANNNTVLLLELQSSPATYVPEEQIISLSFQQAQINSQLFSTLTNASATKSKLLSLQRQIMSTQSIPSVSLFLVRSIDAPVATAILGMGQTPYTAAISEAPLLSTIVPIIISIILVLLLIMLQRKLVHGNRIRSNSRTRRNWRLLFAFAGVLAIAYIVLTYNVAVIANAGAPLGVAGGAIGAAPGAVIAINGTSNPAIASCAGLIKSRFLSENKTVAQIQISGNACTGGPSSAKTTDQCLSYYASKGLPVLMISNASKNSLTAYSFYGTVLRQAGNQQFTSQCLASLFAS